MSSITKYINFASGETLPIEITESDTTLDQDTDLDFLLFQIKNNVVSPSFRILVLYPDDSVAYEIPKDDIKTGGSYSENYQNGQRRSLSFTVWNGNKEYSPTINSLWAGTRLRLDMGITMADGQTVWVTKGVFIITKVTPTLSASGKEVAITASDKFSIFEDATGRLDDSYEIEPGEEIKNIIKTILLTELGDGYPMDSQPMLYHSSLEGKTTQTTISKSAGDTMGSILLELATQLSAEIFYNAKGQLVVIPTNEVTSDSDKPLIYNFDTSDGDIPSLSFDYDYNSIYNRVVVIGNSSNGGTYRAVAVNNNPESPLCYQRIGYRTADIINDSNINTDTLAKERALYELRSYLIINSSTSLNILYNPLLEVNNIVSISDQFFDLNRTRFLINSISCSLDFSGSISITVSNLNNFMVNQSMIEDNILSNRSSVLEYILSMYKNTGIESITAIRDSSTEGSLGELLDGATIYTNDRISFTSKAANGYAKGTADRSVIITKDYTWSPTAFAVTKKTLKVSSKNTEYMTKAEVTRDTKAEDEEYYGTIFKLGDADKTFTVYVDDVIKVEETVREDCWVTDIDNVTLPLNSKPADISAIAYYGAAKVIFTNSSNPYEVSTNIYHGENKDKVNDNVIQVYSKDTTDKKTFDIDRKYIDSSLVMDPYVNCSRTEYSPTVLTQDIEVTGDLEINFDVDSVSASKTFTQTDGLNIGVEYEDLTLTIDLSNTDNMDAITSLSINRSDTKCLTNRDGSSREKTGTVFTYDSSKQGTSVERTVRASDVLTLKYELTEYTEWANGGVINNVPNYYLPYTNRVYINNTGNALPVAVAVKDESSGTYYIYYKTVESGPEDAYLEANAVLKDTNTYLIDIHLFDYRYKYSLNLNSKEGTETITDFGDGYEILDSRSVIPSVSQTDPETETRYLYPEEIQHYNTLSPYYKDAKLKVWAFNTQTYMGGEDRRWYLGLSAFRSLLGNVRDSKGEQGVWNELFNITINGDTSKDPGVMEYDVFYGDYISCGASTYGLNSLYCYYKSGASAIFVKDNSTCIAGFITTTGSTFTIQISNNSTLTGTLYWRIYDTSSGTSKSAWISCGTIPANGNISKFLDKSLSLDEVRTYQNGAEKYQFYIAWTDLYALTSWNYYNSVNGVHSSTSYLHIDRDECTVEIEIEAKFAGTSSVEVDSSIYTLL